MVPALIPACVAAAAPIAFIVCTGKGRSVVRPGNAKRETEAQEDSARINVAERDVSDNAGDEGPQVAERSCPLEPVEAQPGWGKPGRIRGGAVFH
jgi:hypothetical protein